MVSSYITKMVKNVMLQILMHFCDLSDPVPITGFLVAFKLVRVTNHILKETAVWSVFLSLNAHNHWPKTVACYQLVKFLLLLRHSTKQSRYVKRIFSGRTKKLSLPF